MRRAAKPARVLEGQASAFGSIHDELGELVRRRGLRPRTHWPPTSVAPHMSSYSFAGHVQVFAFSAPELSWGVTWHLGPIRSFPYAEAQAAIDLAIQKLKEHRDDARRSLGEWLGP